MYMYKDTCQVAIEMRVCIYSYDKPPFGKCFHLNKV